MITSQELQKNRRKTCLKSFHEKVLEKNVLEEISKLLNASPSKTPEITDLFNEVQQDNHRLLNTLESLICAEEISEDDMTGLTRMSVTQENNLTKLSSDVRQAVKP